MAKKSMVAKNEKRKKMVAKYSKRRKELTTIIKNPESTFEEKQVAYASIGRMPRDASATRVRNRCFLSGRPRGYVRKFGLSRIALRNLALRGDLPGVTKASW